MPALTGELGRPMTIFEEFAAVVQEAREDHLDPTEGLASRFVEVCQQKAAGEEVSRWTLERNTWSIIQRLYLERIDSSGSSSGGALTQIDPYETPLSMVQRCFEEDALLNEFRVVKEWLQETVPPLYRVEPREGYWPQTWSRIRADTRGKVPLGFDLAKRTNTKTVTEMDPDAPNRGQGGLAPQDDTYDKALLRSLFEHVRAGRLDIAMNMCRESDQDWRAASLRGGIFYDDPKLTGTLDEMDFDEDGQPIRRDAPMGNRDRLLWKMMSRSLAANSDLDKYERALYGALSGDLQSVLNVSETWEDHLWAYVSSAVESRLEVKLSQAGGWWSQRAEAEFGRAGEAGSTNVGERQTVDKWRKEGELTFDAIFNELLQSQDESVRLASRDPYRMAQMFIMLGRVTQLLETVANRLSEIEEEWGPTFDHILRFYSHLILLLRFMEQPLPQGSCNVILRRYVYLLKDRGQDELVAMYASALEEESATESYARFLQSMDPDTNIETKQAALLRGSEYDLNLVAVARRTVELIFDDTLVQPLNQSDWAITQFGDRPNALEQMLIRGVDWLTFDESTYSEALYQINALMRYFLSNGRRHAAGALLSSLSSSLIVAFTDLPGVPEDQRNEFAQYQMLFDALHEHMRWTEIWPKRPKTPKDSAEFSSWSEGMRMFVDNARTTALAVLESDWLKFDIEEDSAAVRRRREELARIRQLYIPEIVFSLYRTLLDSSEVVPESLAQALQLANLVADERSKLYLDFITESGGNKLGDFLALVRRAALEQLRVSQEKGVPGGPDVFRAAAGGTISAAVF